MSYPVFDPPVQPSFGGLAKRARPRVTRIPMGDGYTQRIADGTNHMIYEVQATWDTLTTAQADNIEAFFEARGGYEAFDYTIPGAADPIRWSCQEWERGKDDWGKDTFTARLIREFDP